MTPQPVAASPKEMTPRHLPLPMPDFGVNFAQVLASGTAMPAANGQTDAPAPTGRPKSKTDNDDTSAAAAAAAAAAAVPPQVLQPITAATAAGVKQVAAPPSPGTLAAGASAIPDPGTSEPAGGTNATGRTAAPPGAAELNARVVAAAPTYLSQPNAALAGLWHHTGADAETAPGPQQQDAAGARPPADDAPTPQAPAAQSTQSAALASDLATTAHTAPGIVAAAATLSDAATASTSADTDASNAGAITVSLPAGGTQTPQSVPQAAGPTLPTPTLVPAVEQVVFNLKQAVQNGTNRIEIQLKPAALGAIDIKLDLTHDGRITAVISADRSDTLNMLRQDASGLQQALRDAGLQADSSSLSFNLRGDAQSFAQNSTPAPAPTPSSTGFADEPDAPPSWHGNASQLRRHDGALNIEV